MSQPAGSTDKICYLSRQTTLGVFIRFTKLRQGILFWPCLFLRVKTVSVLASTSGKKVLFQLSIRVHWFAVNNDNLHTQNKDKFPSGPFDINENQTLTDLTENDVSRQYLSRPECFAKYYMTISHKTVKASWSQK